MEISDCIWDEGFPLTVEELGDLEQSLSTRIDSPELVPFQCSEVPLLDEADNSDMTPQCMPVIDPNFVRDSYIDGCVLEGVNDVISIGDDVLTNYLIGQECGDLYRSLHVLVCGSCHSVFHLLDHFKSHINSCTGKEDYSESYHNVMNMTYTAQKQEKFECVGSLALVLWTSMVLRRVKDHVLDIFDQTEVCNKIQSKWSSLSVQTRQVWEKAAEAIQELARVGSIVFPEQSAHQPQQKETEQVISAHDYQDRDNYMEYIDEIELSTQLQSNQKCIEPEFDVSTITRLTEDNSSSTVFKHFDDKTMEEKAPPNITKFTSRALQRKENKNNISSQKRDRQGRWQKPKKVDESAQSCYYTCNYCKFYTNNPWKIARHRDTIKHINIMKQNDIHNGQEKYDIVNVSDEDSQKSCLQNENIDLKTKYVKKRNHENTIPSTRVVGKRASAMNAYEKVHSWTSMLGNR